MLKSQSKKAMMKSEYALFGHPIQIKHLGCRIGDAAGSPIPPCVNLFVKVTNACNAHCLFCSNAGHSHDRQKFDVDKLFLCIDEILKERIILNRLNITGGEPSVVPELVNQIIERLTAKPEYQHMHLHLNTNGLLPESQKLMRIGRFDSISISLHHYDLSKLKEIYHCDIPSQAMDFNGIDIDKVNLSCNLIKGYIDKPEEAKKMLDKTIDMGIPRIGFVGLMPVNNYCKERFVDLEDIHIETIPHVYFTRSKNRGSDCKCSNYLYNKDGKILEIYMRNYMNPRYCESSLVFDGQYLRQGFSDNNIIF